MFIYKKKPLKSHRPNVNQIALLLLLLLQKKMPSRQPLIHMKLLLPYKNQCSGSKIHLVLQKN